MYAKGISKLLGQAPNINIRQVWARMVSQMIAKSEIARKWGGSAIWVVQDALLDYLDRSSGLNLVEMRSMAWKLGEVNLISANIDDPTDLKFFTGPIKSNNRDACWIDILSSPVIPDVNVINEKLLQKTPRAKFVVR